MHVERVHRATVRPVILYWKNLREQFSCECSGSKNGKKCFKKNFLKALKMVYPTVDFEMVSGGVLIGKSQPQIPKNQKAIFSSGE